MIKIFKNKLNTKTNNNKSKKKFNLYQNKI